MKRMVTFASVAAAVLGLAACQTGGGSSPVYQTSSSFNPKQAAYVFTQGTGQISGRAFVRTPNGEVSAARSKVTLVPATDYARERVRMIYNGRNIATVGTVSFERADKRYHAYTRSTQADGEGRFLIKNVGPGAYYVTTSVIFGAGDNRTRVSLIEEVSLDDGEASEITLNAVYN